MNTSFYTYSVFDLITEPHTTEDVSLSDLTEIDLNEAQSVFNERRKLMGLKDEANSIMAAFAAKVIMSKKFKDLKNMDVVFKNWIKTAEGKMLGRKARGLLTVRHFSKYVVGEYLYIVDPVVKSIIAIGTGKERQISRVYVRQNFDTFPEEVIVKCYIVAGLISCVEIGMQCKLRLDTVRDFFRDLECDFGVYLNAYQRRSNPRAKGGRISLRRATDLALGILGKASKEERAWA